MSGIAVSLPEFSPIQFGTVSSKSTFNTTSLIPIGSPIGLSP